MRSRSRGPHRGESWSVACCAVCRKFDEITRTSLDMAKNILRLVSASCWLLYLPQVISWFRFERSATVLPNFSTSISKVTGCPPACRAAIRRRPYPIHADRDEDFATAYGWMI